MFTNKTRILYVSHEMDPYLELSNIAKIARQLPPAMQNKGMEIRVLMPRYGLINERRHRLHEVVRLSGINIIIGDNDNPLVIKVASLPAAKMQVYFLDNEDFFQRKAALRDKEDNFFADNHERMIFFCKGVLDTVVKLGWIPDLVHCNGWMTSLIPLYIKKLYHNNPIFENSNVITSVYENQFTEILNESFIAKALYEDISPEDMELFAPGTNKALNMAAIKYSDAVVIGSPDVDEDVKEFVASKNKLTMDHVEEDGYPNVYYEFYQKILEELAVVS